MTETLPSGAVEAASAVRPDVLILTASVGTGHNQAARAIQAELASRRDDLTVEVQDVLDLAGTYFRTKYAGGYTLTVTKFPRCYGLGFAINDRPSGPDRTLGERWRLLRERWAMPRLIDLVREASPSLIIHTHMLAGPLLTRAMQAGQLPEIPQFSVVTDVYAHRWWYAEGIERWYVAQEASTKWLRAWGVSPDRITVSGIPIMPKWSQPLPPRDELCHRLRLPADRDIVLLSGGAEFTCGPVVRIARRLAEAAPQACVVALAGRNKPLLARLTRLAEGYPGRIVPMGFTDRMHELAAVASLLVTKPGGIITAEALAAGTPMLFLRPVPGQEEHNAAFFVEQGAGVIARRAGQAVAIARGLLAEPSQLATMSQAARSLYRPGRETIAADVIARLEQGR